MFYIYKKKQFLFLLSFRFVSGCLLCVWRCVIGMACALSHIVSLKCLAKGDGGEIGYRWEFIDKSSRLSVVLVVFDLWGIINKFLRFVFFLSFFLCCYQCFGLYSLPFPSHSVWFRHFIYIWDVPPLASHSWLIAVYHNAVVSGFSINIFPVRRWRGVFFWFGSDMNLCIQVLVNVKADHNIPFLSWNQLSDLKPENHLNCTTENLFVIQRSSDSNNRKITIS